MGDSRDQSGVGHGHEVGGRKVEDNIRTMQLEAKRPGPGRLGFWEITD